MKVPSVVAALAALLVGPFTCARVAEAALVKLSRSQAGAQQVIAAGEAAAKSLQNLDIGSVARMVSGTEAGAALRQARNKVTSLEHVC